MDGAMALEPRGRLATLLVAPPDKLLPTREKPPPFVDCALTTVNDGLVAPARTVLVLKYHWYAMVGAPMTVALNVAPWPALTLWLCGCERNEGFTFPTPA